MIFLSRTTRQLSLAIFLSLGLFVHALISSTHGWAIGHDGHGEFETVIICSDGELREILVDANGLPVEHQPDHSECPLCLASGKLLLGAPVLLEGPVLNPRGNRLQLISAFGQVDSNIPETANCLDPPLSV